jgi:hypothetical protein
MAQGHRPGGPDPPAGLGSHATRGIGAQCPLGASPDRRDPQRPIPVGVELGQCRKCRRSHGGWGHKRATKMSSGPKHWRSRSSRPCKQAMAAPLVALRSMNCAPAQTFSASAADVHGLELAALDTLQQGLAGHAVGKGGFEGGQPVVKWCVRPPGGAHPRASAPTVRIRCAELALLG